MADPRDRPFRIRWIRIPVWALVPALCLAGAIAPAQATTEPDPANATADGAATGMADLSEANAAVRDGDYPRAASLLEALAPQHPDDPRVLLMHGEVLLALGRTGEAVPPLSRAAELDPERPRIHFQLASARAATGDPEGALAAFGRELELSEDARIREMARINRSLLLERQQRWGDAAGEWEALLAERPDLEHGWGELVRIRIQARDLDAAAATLERAATTGFRSAPLEYAVGAGYFKKKSWAQAEAAFRRAIEIDPSMAAAERSVAACLDRQGRRNEALPHLERFLQLEPNDPDGEEIRERIRAASGG